MSITNDQFDSTDLAAMIPEVWTDVVMEELFANTVFANFCLDLSDEAAEGGDIFHLPDVYSNSFTPKTQSTQGAEVDTESVPQTDQTLTVDTHKYIAILIGDKDLKQIARKYSINDVYARKIGKTLADALEDAIAALWSSISTNTIGDTSTVLSDAEVRQAIEKLESSNYNIDELGFFVHPYVYWNQLHAIAKYYDASIRGDEGNPVVSGNFGSAAAERSMKGVLYGIPLFVTSNVVSGLQTYRNMLLHKDAFAFALQTMGGGKVRIQVKNRPENLAMLTVADIVYGVKAVREEGAVLLNASSAFIGS